MKYPISVETMRLAYKQGEENADLELDEKDNRFIEALTSVINAAYEAGVQDATKQLKKCVV